MTTPQILINDEVRRQVLLEGVKEGTWKEFESFLKDLDKSLRERLTREGNTIETKRRLNALISDVNAIQRDIYSGYTEQLELRLDEIAIMEAELEQSSLNKVVIDYDVTLPSDQQIIQAYRNTPLSIRNQSFTFEPFIKDFTETQIRLVNSAINQGYVEGQTISQILQNIRGTRANNFADGVIGRINKNDRIMVRTAIQNASSQAKQRLWEANSDLIQGVEWVSTLDSRTSTQCFTGSTVFQSIGDCEKIFRAKYTGDIITITTSSGNKIECTSNHPILTSKGWVCANELDPCKHVIYSTHNNVGMVRSKKKVGVESTFSEAFDSLSNISGSNVIRRSSSARDFYGDGVFLDGDIDILEPDSKLRRAFISIICENIKNKSFSFVKDSFLFLCLCCLCLMKAGWPPISKTSKFTTRLIKGFVNPRFRPVKLYNNLTWPKSFIKHLNCSSSIIDYFRVAFSSSETWHNTYLLEKACNCSCSSFVIPSNTGCRFPVVVSSDNIISISSKFKSCHVYTLQSSLGYYIAGSSIVKNCRSLDGQIFPIDKGPRPPIHFGCRSTTVPVLNNKFDFLKSGAKRPSKGAEGVKQVGAGSTYYGWLKTQPASFQDAVLGDKRGKLLRNGGITAERFADLQLNNNFQPRTIEEMREIAPKAFDEAGL